MCTTKCSVWDLGSGLFHSLNFRDCICCLWSINACTLWRWAHEYMNDFEELLSQAPPPLQSPQSLYFPGTPLFLSWSEKARALSHSMDHFPWYHQNQAAGGQREKNNRGSPHPLGTSAPLIIVENSTCCLFQNHCLGAGTLKKKKQRRSKRIKETQVIFTLYLSVRRPLSLSLSQNWRLLLKFSLSVVTLTSRLQAGLSSGQRLKGKKS